MNRYGLVFHHFGLAVRKKEKAIRFVRGLGYEVENEVYDPLQEINLTICQSESMPDIEIITRSDKPGPLEHILKDRDEMIYHMCYETLDVESSLRAIKDDGNRIMCISSAKPAVVFGQRLVSFYKVVGFGIIEILQ